MTLTPDQQTENRIMQETIKVLLAAGFNVTVDDGGATPVEHSRDPDLIFGAMKSTDEDTLIAWNPDGKRAGLVVFVYGNDGRDVICDYSTRLEDVLAPVFHLADSLETI
jgi:hypothetical protein